jgi:hypothetical protein
MFPRIFGPCLLALLGHCSVTLAADLNSFLPADAKFVVLIRARHLLDAPLVDRDMPFTLKGILKEDFHDPTVLTVKPLDEIVTALIALPSVGEAKKVFVALEGKFDPVAIRAQIALRFKNTVKEHGSGLEAFQELRIPPQNFQGVTTPSEVYLAVPNARTCLISLGCKEDLVTALSEKKAGTPASLRELIEKSDKEQVVSYALLNELAGPLAERKELKRAFSLIQTIHGGGRIDEDVSGNAIVTTSNPESCRDAADIIRKGLDTITGAVALLINVNKDFKPALDVLRTVRISSKGDQITIRVKLERDVLEDLIKKRQPTRSGK